MGLLVSGRVQIYKYTANIFESWDRMESVTFITHFKRRKPIQGSWLNHT